MRGKEEAHDYRYFPDPDLVPLVVSDDWIAEIRGTLPELPDAKKARYTGEFGLPEYDAEVLSASRDIADYFDACVALYPQAKPVSNWVMGEVLRALKEDNRAVADCPVTPRLLTEMLRLVEQGTISGKIAKTVFDEMYKTGKEPAGIVEEKGLVQVSDSGAIEQIIDEVLVANPDNVEQYRGGKEKLFGFFVGQVMKASRGKANPALVNELLLKKLKG
jgi:aspartyl-tRNA(Asn)/glutamyl-tRNA(Gln) amidotransferase subunit B